MGAHENISGCLDEHGAISEEALRKDESLDAAYSRLQREKESLPHAEYERRLHTLCLEILEREG
jgi:hypothetical protein